MRILVTGATGNTGGAVVRDLMGRGVDVVAASRGGTEIVGATPVVFDWLKPETWDAVAAVDGIYVVPPLGQVRPATSVEPLLRRAVDGGTRRVVLLGSSAVTPGSPGAGELPELVREIVPDPVVVRPSWFMQNLTGHHLLGDGIRQHDTITTATGGGRVPLIDANDIGASAAAALVADRPPAFDLVLTGPQAMDYGRIASIVSEVAGRPIRFESLTEDELRDRLADTMPTEYAVLLARLDADIAAGAEDRVTDTVERLTGRPPTALGDFLRAHAEDLRPDA